MFIPIPNLIVFLEYYNTYIPPSTALIFTHYKKYHNPLNYVSYDNYSRQYSTYFHNLPHFDNFRKCLSIVALVYLNSHPIRSDIAYKLPMKSGDSNNRNLVQNARVSKLIYSAP